MAQRPFGSDSTRRKLQVLEEYLRAYQRALKKFPFRKLYIDAFAGSGEIPSARPGGENLFDLETQQVTTGSAVRALEIETPFDEYIFIDRSKKNISELRERLSGHSHFDRCEFIAEDANDIIPKVCARYNWRNTRAVTFLDPFGNQVKWETVVALAQTNGTDIWYLFPSGVGVFRQIGSGGTVDPTHEKSIDLLYGTQSWREAFLEVTEVDDLFGRAEQRERVVTPEIATKFMQERMKELFDGNVLDQTLPLGKHAYPSFHLIFAWANKSEKTKRLAQRLGKAVLKAAIQ